MKTKLMNSKFAKLLRRIGGEETGAVMMEYVIVAVLIAAAVAVGAWYFGRSVTNEFSVASHAVTGDNTGAYKAEHEAQDALGAQDAAARTQQKQFINADTEDSGDITGTVTR